VTLPRGRVDDLEAHAPVRKAEDLVSHGVLRVPSRVGDDHDLELEPLRRVDGQQPDGVATLLLRHGLALARAGRLLVCDEAEEAFDLGAAELFVRTRQPRQLAQVGVAPAPVPAGEDGEVVVVLGDDALAETLEARRRRRAHEPVVALAEGFEKAAVARPELGRELALHSAEERPLPGRAAEQIEGVVGDADEGRGEDARERLVVVAVEDQAQIHRQVRDLLLAEVPAPGRPVGRQSLDPQRLLVALGVGARSEEEDDVTRRRLARVDELTNAAGDMAGLRDPPMHVSLAVARLVGDEQLHGRSEDRVGEASGRDQRLVLSAELGPEEVVDDIDDLGPGAVVLGQRQHACARRTALAEDLDVGVAEAVDRLELVADEEDLVARDEVDELTLEAVRVLELVDENRPESPPRIVPHLLVHAQEVAGAELKVLEVERRLSRLRLGIGGVEGAEQLHEQRPVARRDLVESSPLDRPERLAEGGKPLPLLPADPQVGEIEEVLRGRNRLEKLERVLDLRASGQRLLGVAQRDLRDLAQLGHAVGKRRDGLARKLEWPACRAQAVVHAREHPSETLGPVGGEEPHAFGLSRLHVRGEGLREGLRAEHRRLALVEHAEARVEPGLERMRAQKPVAEAVDRRDPARVQVACEIVTLELHEPLPDARAQLPGRALGVGDDEDVVDAEPALAHGLDEPLDEHGGLPRPGSRRDEDDAPAPRSPRPADRRAWSS
jgi:hypothetical protein